MKLSLTGVDFTISYDYETRIMILYKPRNLSELLRGLSTGARVVASSVSREERWAF